MKRRNLLTLSILSCFIVAFLGSNAHPMSRALHS
jgi:hypothetical protein